MNSTTPASDSSHQATLQIKFDWRLLVALLLLVIAGLTYIWKPWQSNPAKTITVRGEASVKAVPDTYLFQPAYQDAEASKATALGNTAVAKLKELGVKSEDIKTSVTTSAGKPVTTLIYPPQPELTPQSTFSITATVRNKSAAQKIADYLAETKATGQITPQAQLDKSTRTKLDLQARSKASDDAKAKAGVMAKQLGARLGKVRRISEENGYGMYALDSAATPNRGSSDAVQSKPASSGPTIEPGTDEVQYTFTVVFELK